MAGRALIGRLPRAELQCPHAGRRLSSESDPPSDLGTT
ncbi:hypothetical protein [Curtobacterium phage Penoan]|nr:hypothetical protein [Curtobacterium phage Penoan]